MIINNIIVSSSIYHGLWTTISFHVESASDISSTSKRLMEELETRYKDLPDHVNAEYIGTSINRMFLTTSIENISEVNFQLDYTDGDKKITIGVDWGQIPMDNHALFNIMPDSAGNLYKEILMSNNEKIRITLIKDSWDGDNGIRIQIREPNGHLRQGPEIPSSYVDELIRELKTFKNYAR